jgi:hypothetical protein
MTKLMKAISIQQPWAWALFHGKPVENRTWRTDYRGDLLIHASKVFDMDGFKWLRSHGYLLDDRGAEIIRSDKILGYYGNNIPSWFDLGCIIGKVNMVDCVVHHPEEWFFGPYGHVYANPIEFKTPIPFKGKLKFFDVPDELIRGLF